MPKKHKLPDLSQYPIDRIGKAYCRMNCFIWDRELFGAPPRGWAGMFNRSRYENPEFRKCMGLIDELLSEEQKSMYWWTLELKRSYSDWEKWYKQKGGKDSKCVDMVTGAADSARMTT